MIRLCLLCLLALAGCNKTTRCKPTLFLSPLTRSEWTTPGLPQRSPPLPAQHRENESPQPDRSNDRPLREEVIASAKALLQNKAEYGDFGERDLEIMLHGATPAVSWRAADGLGQLTSLAKKRGAFSDRSSPRPGDIVLFHNQADKNGNGQVDDWLTGCGVVIAVDGEQFDAVVRTGHAPRQVTVSRQQPTRRVVDGIKVNSYLRVPHPSDRPQVEYLAGALFAGHIDIEELVAGEK